ncbi:M14 family zinc carboxypeptidase [Microlunatus endophyticus]
MQKTGIDLESILQFTDRLPEVDGFLPVDDLIARFDALADSSAGRVIRSRAGTSRLGEPIHSYTVGDGPRTALIVGGVHPNEPIGSWTALWLAEAAAAKEEPVASLGYRWCIVPTIDPDGARLNESWFANPADRIGYGRGFYRPAPDGQAEWTFPTNYKNAYFDRVLPETLAFMRLIDDLRPDLLVSLHNGEMGVSTTTSPGTLPDSSVRCRRFPITSGCRWMSGNRSRRTCGRSLRRSSGWTPSVRLTTTTRTSASTRRVSSRDRPPATMPPVTGPCAWSRNCRTGSIPMPATPARRRRRTPTCCAAPPAT